MKKSLKKLLSVILVVTMVLPMILVFSISSFAATNHVTTWQQLQNAVNNAQDGDVIIVDNDITLSTLGSGNVVTLCSMTLTKKITVMSEGEPKTITRPQWHHTQPVTNTSGSINVPARPVMTLSNGAELTLKNITVSSVTDFTNGLQESAFIIYNGAKLILDEGSTIQNFRNTIDSFHGGALTIAEGGALDILDGGKITKCASYNFAGAILNSGTINIYDGAELSENSASGQGGCILNMNTGVINMYGGTFSNNASGTYGGALSNLGTINISGGEIINNSASQAGGGIQYQDGNIYITGGLITGNSANFGGGIARYHSTDSQVTSSAFCKIENCAIYGNRTPSLTSTTYKGADVYSNRGGSETSVLVWGCPMTSSITGTTYCVYNDNNNTNSTVRCDGTYTCASNREGHNYPQTAGGYRFIQVSAMNDTATLERDASSVTIPVTANDAAGSSKIYGINGINSTKGSYVSAPGGFEMSLPTYTLTTVKTTYGTATISGNNIIYTPDADLIHTVDLVDEFYYDCRVAISSAQTSFGSCAKVTVTLEKNCDCEHTLQTETVNPTCTEDGYTRTYCTKDCGYEVIETIDALNHDLKTEVINPYCTTGGYTRIYCQREECDYEEITDEVAALGHAWVQQEIDDPMYYSPDCTNTGYGHFKCSRCEAEEDHEIPALDHDYQPVVTNATCTTAGYTTYTCSRCTDSYTSDDVAALGHVFSILLADRYTSTTHTYKCTRCEAVETTNHAVKSSGTIYIYDSSTTETAEAGHYTQCDACKKAFGSVIAHDINTTVVAASCVANGSITRICNNCNYSTYEVTTGSHVPDLGAIAYKTGSAYDGLVNCLKPRQAIYRCVTCGTDMSTRDLDPTGHVYNSSGICIVCGSPESYTPSTNYIYKYVDQPVAGREYIIANTNTVGNAYAVSNTNIDTDNGNTVYSVPVRIKSLTTSDIGTLYGAYNSVITSLYNAQAIRWNAVANSGKLSFTNVADSNKYISANIIATGINQAWYHRNLSIQTGTPDATGKFTVTPTTNIEGDTGVTSGGKGSTMVTGSGAYVGFKNTENATGYTLPGGKVVVSGGNGENSGKENYYAEFDKIVVNGQVKDIGKGRTSDEYVPSPEGSDPGTVAMDVDFCFEANSNMLQIHRPQANGYYQGTRVAVYQNTVIFYKENEDLATFKYGINPYSYIRGIIRLSDYEDPITHTKPFQSTDGLVVGSGVWHHLRIESIADTSVSIYVDGYRVLYVEGFDFSAEYVKEWCYTVPGSTWDNTGSHRGLYFFNWEDWRVASQRNLTIALFPPEEGDTNLSNYKSVQYMCDTYGLRAIDYNSVLGEHLLLDNVRIYSDGQYYYDDFDTNRNMSFVTANYGFATREDYTGEANPQYEVRSLAENQFVAGADNTNKVYFFEKEYKTTINFYQGYTKESATTMGTRTVYLPAETQSINSYMMSAPSGMVLTDVIVNGTSNGANTNVAIAADETNGNTINVYFLTNQRTVTIEYRADTLDGTVLDTVTSTMTIGDTVTLDKDRDFTNYTGTGTAYYNGSVYSENTATVSTDPNANTYVIVMPRDLSYTINVKVNTPDALTTYNTVKSITVEGVLTGTVISLNTAVAKIEEYYTPNSGIYTIGDYTYAIKSSNAASITIALSGSNVYDVYFDTNQRYFTVTYRAGSLTGDVISEQKTLKTVGQSVMIQKNNTGSDFIGYTGPGAVYQNGVEYPSYPNYASVKVNTNPNFNKYVVVMPKDNIVNTTNGNDYVVSFANTSISLEKLLEYDFSNELYTCNSINKIGDTIAEGKEINTPYATSVVSGTVDGIEVVNNNSLKVTVDEADFTATGFYIEYNATYNSTDAIYVANQISVIVADAIYFDDNANGFITYNNGENGTWSETSSISAPTYDYSDTFGYSDTGLNYSTFGGGSAHVLNVLQNTPSSKENWSYAQFSFTGTGFEVISFCNEESGVIFVDITNDETGKPVKTLVINDYNGYSYEYDSAKGKYVWTPSDAENAAYQVPVIRQMGLTYGAYTVRIRATYYKDLKMRQGGAKFYLDAVRIFNPLPAESVDAQVIYGNAAQKQKQIIELNSIISDENAYYLTSNHKAATVEEYKKCGSNNEVYLGSGSSMNFSLSNLQSTDKVYIAASSLDGKSVTLRVKSTDIKTLTSTTEMYYDITSALGGSGSNISITNNGTEGSVLVVSVIKITNSGSALPLSVAVSRPDVETAEAYTSYYAGYIKNGDVSGDGRITSRDTMLLKKYLMNATDFSTSQYLAADFDHDGRITSKDLYALKKSNI